MKLDIEKIKELLVDGKTLKEVGEIFQVSRQRIGQIRNKYFPDLSKSEFGSGKVRKDRRKKQVEGWKRESWILDDLARAQHIKFNRKRQANKSSKHCWDLKLEDIVWNTHCPILGIELDYFADSRAENSPSFDRIDSSLGYIKGNVIIISWRANRIKNDGTVEEHQKIVDFLKKLNK